MISWWTLLLQILKDLKENKPIQQPAPSTGADLLEDLEKFEVLIPKIKAWLKTHPGTITATDDLLIYLQVDYDANKIPKIVCEISDWLPGIISFLRAIQPAPIGIPGG